MNKFLQNPEKGSKDEREFVTQALLQAIKHFYGCVYTVSSTESNDSYMEIAKEIPKVALKIAKLKSITLETQRHCIDILKYAEGWMLTDQITIPAEKEKERDTTPNPYQIFISAASHEIKKTYK